MKLKKSTLIAINNTRTRLKLAVALDVTEQCIMRYIAKNNDKLTKAAAMAVIKSVTGLTDDEILEPAIPVNA